MACLFPTEPMRLSVLALALVLAGGCQRAPAHLAVEDPFAGEAFALVDQDSAAVVFPGDFAGRPLLFSAVYTHCPDVCPATMANLARVREALGADTARVRFVTASFDPARDTPARLRAYARTWHLGRDWRLVTGDSAEIARLMDRVEIRTRVSRQDTLASGNVFTLIDHSDKLLLFDARGRIVETYGGTAVRPEMVADDLRALL